ncbi:MULTISPECIES: catecholate siderophore receptor Fiu [unclassified Rhodanobacter]|uniref:catecholate siderophore receptor Fiu n=1 Tax=unclassified Rhodanobacter TaxID=2621553 RepID=UPI001BDDFFC5|nr:MULTISPECIES: catecholate siderophore receptor Fiu [unclassified Rhodanobacter]MBT2143087.1 catecholate siderophore receptor Fiu [Rhodanobacter sp. LX-99]MBT2147840.1 catecholate siderophore receptor Fiu [Rhodanobacter sp. LX-100]
MSPIKSRKHAVGSRRQPSTAGMLTAATLVTGLVLVHPAMAADASSSHDAQIATAKNLPGVKVEATTGNDYRVDKLSSPKFTQPLLDTTQTVSVITKELLQQQGATTLTEALRNSPGVGTFYVGENGNTSTGDGIYMRGFDTSGSIFVDGVRDLGTISRDVFNIEQVEVAKGPAGTDYGRTAPTGSVNLVSKQPQLGNGISGSIGYGSGRHRRATADWNQTLGEHSAFRLNVMGQNSGVPGRDKVENNRWGIAPSLALGLKTPTRVYLDFLHVRQDNLPDGGVPTIGLPGYGSPDPARPFLAGAAMVDPQNFYGTRADHDNVEADMFTAIVEHDVSPDVVLHNTTRWGRTHQDYLLTSFRGDTANLLTPDAADPLTWTIARSLPTFKDQTNRILTNQANVTANFDTGGITHNLSAGIELTREKAGTVGLGALNGSAWPAANLYRPDADVNGLVYGRTGAHSEGRTDTAAAYLFDTLKFNEQWQVNAGMRLDHYSTDFSSMVVCGARNGPACGALPAGSVLPGVDSSTSGNLPNYKLGVLYKPAANGSVYANFAVSQEPPGGNTLTLSDRANSADNPNLDPQKARTVELGTKWDLLGEKLLLTGALYRTTVSNDLVQDPVDLQYYQVGRKRVQGIELSAVGKLTGNWAISAGYTVMDAKVLHGSAVANDGSSDLAYTPKSAFTAWTTYRLPFNLTLGGGGRYAGEMKRGTDGAIGTPAYTEAYWVFDAMASYPLNKHVDLQLNLYNLFDKDYVAAINKSGYRYTPGTPRAAMLTANIRF